jgi:energy-coupling factor transporter ATP-binding protein EcfA2
MIPAATNSLSRDWDDLFVGRMKELERIRSELAAGHNLVLTGPFGIGRTTLLSHLARALKPELRFIFFEGSQTPGQICEQLLVDGSSVKPTARKRTLPWKIERHRLESRKDRDPRPVVLVLDDVAKVTPPKLDFIHWLHGLHRYRIIAVTERFLPEKSLMHLRSALYPAPMVALGPLSAGMAQRFFEAWAVRHGLNWGPDIIHGLVLATRGYPTGMWEAARDAMKNQSGLGSVDLQRHEGTQLGGGVDWAGSGQAEDQSMNP